VKVEGMAGLARCVVAVIAATVLLCASSCRVAFAAGDANRLSCSEATEASPGFRGWLPDCRAYELVSPPYGAGALAQNVNRFPSESLDGEHVLAESFGAFAEAEALEQVNTGYGEVYEFSRTPGGWTAEPQDPPASTYSFRQIRDEAATTLSRPADVGHSLWTALPNPLPGEERLTKGAASNNSLYLLREDRDLFNIVGPLAAPGHRVDITDSPGHIDGASADASHVVFTVEADGQKQLWPGDSTEEGIRTSSLYEYGLGGGEPVLVGVRNEGQAPWEPVAAHVNEGAQLVSDCGTLYDGMSTSGESVFFTAQNNGGCAASQPPVSELYARVDGSRTVAISEPSVEDCSACDEGTPEEATFVGASEDGSKVFFASTQQLLAGASGESLYEYDFDAPAGERVSLLVANVLRMRGRHSAPRAFGQVARDGARVYFESEDAVTTQPNGNGETAVAGQPNLFVFDTEPASRADPVAFVAAGTGAEQFDQTRDGQYFVFVSPERLTTDDSSGVPQLFEYDASTGSVVRVSIGQHSPAGYECETTHTAEEGFDCDGNTSNPEDAPRIVSYPGNSVAEDGTVAFVSQLPLTPLAIQGHPVFKEDAEFESYAENVYEYRQGQVYLISPGDETKPAPYLTEQENVMRLFGIDESGRNVFFSSVDPLVPQDTDTQSSWYDAREEGGFPAPISQPGCGGEACQGAVPVAPGLPSQGGTETTVAGANIVPRVSLPPSPKPTRCRKGYVKHKGKCVKVRRSKKAKKAKQAGSDRSARS
jgi:hypothetical protein